MVLKNRSGRLLSLVVAVARSSNDQAEIFDCLKTPKHLPVETLHRRMYLVSSVLLD